MRRVEKRPRRVPRVRRLEYLLDFLRVVERGYNREIVEQGLAERKKAFELEKYRALGRGRPFMKSLIKTKDLSRDCLSLSVRVGFVEGKDKPTLTDAGISFLTLDIAGQRRVFAQSLLDAYLHFPHILVTLSRAPRSEVIVPMKKNNRAFVEEARRFGLRVNQTDFDVLRDLGSQLELTNWHPAKTDKGRYEKVYLTCTLLSREQVESLKASADKFNEPLKFRYNTEEHWAQPISVEYEIFKKTLWRKYLETTRYVPRRPVFYSALREKICYQLRISDQIFDTYTKEIMKFDDDYILVGAGGTLPFQRDSASLIKSLPPKTERGEYIVYLKMDTKQGRS